ncbi:MAG: ParB N-terminal domain-containing protein [Pseudonocardiaceae bacterium]
MELAGWDSIKLDRLPAVVLPISSLRLDDSPRQGGENEDHVRVLADSEEQLPPIIVHGQSMRVIDGLHRIRAAALRGEKKIAAKIYHGSHADAFVLAVRMNITHGLPLTRSDRTRAAVRIIGSYPQWSNRMIATVAGLSAGTIAKLRQRSTAQNTQSTSRIGKDGRARPLNSAAGRLRAVALLNQTPTAPIRAIAEAAGVSPSTVHDVRQRLRAGQDDPALLRPTARKRPTARSGPVTPPPPQAYAQLARDTEGSAPNVDIATILANLKRDPSLRFSDTGRSVIRWLDRHRVGMAESAKIADMIPDHCADTVAKLARGYAQVWTEVAAQLERHWLHRSS